MQHTVYSLAYEDTRLAKASSTSYAGACPNYAKGTCCSDHDGFYIKQDKATGKWFFGCRGCWQPEDFLTEETIKTVIGRKQVGDKRGMGDEINYLHHFRGMTYTQARAFLDGQEVPACQPQKAIKAKWQSEQWQARTHAAIEAYMPRLWSPEGKDGLAYARKRGFSDDTIKAFRLAYSDKDGIPRLLIPNINDGMYTAVYCRDLRPDCPKGERWKLSPDSTGNELYLADILRLRPGYPVVLVEDAFSALSVWQEAGDLVNVVGTGSANFCQHKKWIVALSIAPVVLVALDADNAGDKHSHYWLKRLRNAKRLRPTLKDPNDMLMASYDVRGWVESALNHYHDSGDSGFVPETNPLQAVDETCRVCGSNVETDGRDFHYIEEGDAVACYCDLHIPNKNIPSVYDVLPWFDALQARIKIKHVEVVHVSDLAKMKARVIREYASQIEPTFHEAIARNAARMQSRNNERIKTS